MIPRSSMVFLNFTGKCSQKRMARGPQKHGKRSLEHCQERSHSGDPAASRRPATLLPRVAFSVPFDARSASILRLDCHSFVGGKRVSMNTRTCLHAYCLSGVGGFVFVVVRVGGGWCSTYMATRSCYVSCSLSEVSRLVGGNLPESSVEQQASNCA